MGITAVSSFPVARPTAYAAASSLSSEKAGADQPSGNGGSVYISPAIRYDQQARLAVLVFRDPDSGETRDQIPAEHVVEAYRRNVARKSGAQSPGSQSPAGQTPASSDSMAGGTAGTAAAFGTGGTAAAPSSAPSSVSVGATAPSGGTTPSGGSASGGGRVSVTV